MREIVAGQPSQFFRVMECNDLRTNLEEALQVASRFRQAKSAARGDFEGAIDLLHHRASTFRALSNRPAVCHRWTATQPFLSRTSGLFERSASGMKMWIRHRRRIRGTKPLSHQRLGKCVRFVDILMTAIGSTLRGSLLQSTVIDAGQILLEWRRERVCSGSRYSR